MNWLKNLCYAWGLINILGGFMGLVMGKSPMSLIVGGSAGLLIMILVRLTNTKPATAWRALGIVALALLGFWFYRRSELIAADKSTAMAMMNIALNGGIFVCLGIGHMLGQKQRREAEAPAS